MTCTRQHDKYNRTYVKILSVPLHGSCHHITKVYSVTKWPWFYSVCVNTQSYACRFNAAHCILLINTFPPPIGYLLSTLGPLQPPQYTWTSQHTCLFPHVAPPIGLTPHPWSREMWYLYVKQFDVVRVDMVECEWLIARFYTVSASSPFSRREWVFNLFSSPPFDFEVT